MKHIWSNCKHGGELEWYSKDILVRRGVWSELSKGDMVYIPGNLKAGEPTAMYGPHKVVAPEKNILVNGKGKEFYERHPYVFVAVDLEAITTDYVEGWSAADTLTFAVGKVVDEIKNYNAVDLSDTLGSKFY